MSSFPSQHIDFHYGGYLIPFENIDDPTAAGLCTFGSFGISFNFQLPTCYDCFLSIKCCWLEEVGEREIFLLSATQNFSCVFSCYIP